MGLIPRWERVMLDEGEGSTMGGIYGRLAYG